MSIEHQSHDQTMDKVKAAFARDIKGDWVTNTRNYDRALCECMGFTRDNNSYWDMVIDGVKVEIKKVNTSSREAIIPLVRLAEMKLNPSLADSITVILVYSGNEIIDRMFIHTQRLVDYCMPTKSHARLVRLTHHVFKHLFRTHNQAFIKLSVLHSLSS